MRINTKTMGIIFMGLFIIALWYIFVSPRTNDKDYIITVESIENVQNHFLIHGRTEKGKKVTFENKPCILRGKWNTSSIQGKIKVGSTYQVTTIGYRIPFTDIYKNILEVELESIW